MTDLKSYTETYDAEAVSYLLKMTPTQMQEEFFTGLEVDKNGKPYDFNALYQQTRTVCRQAQAKQMKVTQSYKYAAFMRESRLFVKGAGLQRLCGELRKLLNGKQTFDFDISNAHFRILYKRVRAYNVKHPDEPLSCSYLRSYVTTRQACMEATGCDKKTFLVMLYCDRLKTNKKDKEGFYASGDFMREFHKEKTRIFEALYRTEKDTYAHWRASDSKNPISSFCSSLIGVDENNIVQRAIRHVHENFENRVEVPMFDGICVSRTGVLGSTILASLNELEKDIVWAEKDNLSTYEYDQEIHAQKSMDYAVRKEEFELTRCMIHNPYVFVEQRPDKDGLLEDVIYNEAEFTKKHRNFRVINDAPKKGDKDPYEGIMKQWSQDPDMRSYNGLDFLPFSRISDDDSKHANNFYNMFRPFAAQWVPREEWSQERPEWFLDYIYNGLANGHQGKGDWLVNFIAHIVQKPEVNQEVCLVLRGNQGTGKDTITVLLGRIFGERNNYIHRTADVYEAFPEKAGFNSCLKNKLILQFNEVDGADTSKIKNKLKDAITRRDNRINEKYIKEFIQKNYVQTIVCSNSRSPLQVEWGERRITVMKTADYHTGEEGKGWWSDFYANYVNDQVVIDELFSWLMTRDIRGFNASRDRVKTSEYNRLAESQIPPNVLFLKYLSETNFPGWTTWTNKATGVQYVFTSPRLYVDRGRKWIQDSLKILYNIKASEFQRELQEFEGVEYGKSVKIKGASARYVWIEKAKFVSDITTRYKMQNDDEELEIELDDDCAFLADSDDVVAD